MSLAAMGLPEDADEAAVRTRFKELAMTTHPDRGGSPEQFQQLTAQRDVALNEARMGQTLAHARSTLHALRDAARGAICPRCDGTGERMRVSSGFRSARFVCTMCNGKGKL